MSTEAPTVTPEWVWRAKRQLRRRSREKHGELRCTYCGRTLSKKKGTIDHIEPCSRGGADDIENLALACYACNLSKSNLSLAEWLEVLTRQQDAVLAMLQES